MTDLVSVVVTCYNHEEYIEECLRSIFDQTYQNIELFIFNDGSTDESLQIMHNILPDSPFEKTEIIDQENQGVAYTRNQGLTCSNGEYILFVDSDNYLPDNFVKQLVKTAQEKNADIVSTNLVDIDSGQIFMTTREFALQDFIIGNFIDMCSLIRRSVIKDVVFDGELQKLVDYDFFLNLIIKNNAYAVPEFATHVYYRILDNSMSARDNLHKYYQAYTYLVDKYFIYYPNEFKVALEWHLNRILSLNLSAQMANQFLTIYFSEDGEFDEKNTEKRNIKLSDQVKFMLPKCTKFIRIDLSELPSYYKSVSLVNNRYQTEVLPVSTNAKVSHGHYLFIDIDPQIIYDLSHQNGVSYTLTYEMFNLDNPMSEDYVVNNIAENLISLKEEISELRPYRYHYKELESERDYYKKELEKMVVRYNSVTHSRRWTIPTKIIDIFRRKK